MNATCGRGDSAGQDGRAGDAGHTTHVAHGGRSDPANHAHRADDDGNQIGSAIIEDDELRMLLAEGIGPILHARLGAAFGSAAAVVRAGRDRLAAIEGIGPVRAECIRRSLDSAEPARERRELARLGARIVAGRDPEYPALLATIADPPPALWVRGAFDESDRCCVAVVGSRRCTSYGREQASRLAFALAECGFTIVSGGARGVDAAAHRAALRAGGRTIAVLGCGLGHCYPPEHASLYDAIAAHGAVISESPVLTPPRSEFFPRRNRIISGLSLGVVVVEAADRSGALITAREAAESHHREVMAIPGPVDSPVSAGCHRAIREGWAGLVTGVDDVLAQLESTLQLVAAAQERRSARSPPDDRPISAAARSGGWAVRAAGGRQPTDVGPVATTSAAATGAAATEPGEGPGHLVACLAATLATNGPSSAARLAELVGRPVGSVLASLTLLQLRRHVIRRNGAFVLRTVQEDTRSP